MGFDVTLNELKQMTQNKVTMLGNIPPRDVLANGTLENVVQKTNELIKSLENRTHVIMSCGGGMPPAVSSEKINIFWETVKTN
jgi:uroporphyrinogen-III decarboxylase